MVPPLNNFRTHQFSLICCVSTSVTLQLVCFWVIKGVGITQLISPIKDSLILLFIGIIVGILKSSVVSCIVCLVQPSLRGRLILGSTVALSLLESIICVQVWSATFRFG